MDVMIVPAGTTKAEEKMPGASVRNMAYTAKVMMFQTELKAGTTLTPHTHGNDQVGYVVRGKIEVVAGDKVYACETGGSYAVLGGIHHTIRAVTDAVILDTFNR